MRSVRLNKPSALTTTPSSPPDDPHEIAAFSSLTANPPASCQSFRPVSFARRQLENGRSASIATTRAVYGPLANSCRRVLVEVAPLASTLDPGVLEQEPVLVGNHVLCVSPRKCSGASTSDAREEEGKETGGRAVPLRQVRWTQQRELCAIRRATSSRSPLPVLPLLGFPRKLDEGEKG